MNVSNMLKATMVAGALATGGAAAGIAGASAATGSSTSTTPSTTPTPTTPGTPGKASPAPPAQGKAPSKEGSSKNPCPHMGGASSAGPSQGSNSGAGYGAPGAVPTYQ